MDYKELTSLMRDYANIKQEVNVIEECGTNNQQLKSPYMIAKGPDNELIFRNCSTNQLVIFNKKLQYSHAIWKVSTYNWNSKGHLCVADRDLHCIQSLQ